MAPIRKLVEIFRYRELLKSLVVNDLRLRYRRSVLGFLWTMLNPLLMMLVLTLVFSTVMRFNTKDYSVLLLAGLLPWIFLTQSINNALGSVVGKGSLLRKVYIPKAIIPLSAVLASLVNFVLSFIPFLLLVVIMGRPLNGSLLMVPIAMLLMALFTTGLAYVFACLNVFFRDFTHMTEVIIQAWFYASPIIYTLDMVPERYRQAFAWNPMAYLVSCFRAPLYDGVMPTSQTLLVASLVAVGSFALGFLIFTRFERDFILHV
jgi:ABC-type polysaccharide/polyol phosphate export permease